jgi:hypothetical protein
VRSASFLGALALATLTCLAASARALATRYHECQHPVTTGVEISHLRHVRTSIACPVALSLYSWENKDDHTRKLYICAGRSPGRPVLRMHRFDGWALSLTGKFDLFTMSRGASSFVVSGTDFPVICD